MVTKDFVKLLATEAGTTEKEAKEFIGHFTNAIGIVLADKDSIAINGLGTFKTIAQEAKTGKVPGTDKVWTSAAKTVPKFSYAKAMKFRVA